MKWLHILPWSFVFGVRLHNTKANFFFIRCPALWGPHSDLSGHSSIQLYCPSVSHISCTEHIIAFYKILVIAYLGKLLTQCFISSLSFWLPYTCMSLKDCLWGNNTLWLWNKLKLQGQSIILQNAKCYVKHFRYNIFGVLEENREQVGFSVGCDGLWGQWTRQTRVLWQGNRKRKKKHTSFPWCTINLLLYTNTCTCKS